MLQVICFTTDVSRLTQHTLAVDGFNVVALKPGTVTELLLTDSEGQQLRTFADKEGWFTLHDVNPGTYVLTTYNPMFVYPEVGDSVQQQQQQQPLKHGLMYALQNSSRSDTYLKLTSRNHKLHQEASTLQAWLLTAGAA
jgi:hypothetical protein